jgi:hypothetical protein
MDAASSPDPRRKTPRKAAFLAVGLSSTAKPGRYGVTRNASGKGLLIATSSRFAVGDELALSVLAGNTERRVSARVVRVEENAVSSPEVWRYRLAVELDEELDGALLDQGIRRAG